MKRVIIETSVELLAGIFKNGERHYTVKEGLPEDAKCVGVYFNHTKSPSSISICFESEEFEDIKDGRMSPKITPVFYIDCKDYKEVYIDCKDYKEQK